MSWKTYPKVELHLHHEGAAPPAFIRGLAQEKHVDISKVFDERGQLDQRDIVIDTIRSGLGLDCKTRMGDGAAHPPIGRGAAVSPAGKELDLFRGEKRAGLVVKTMCGGEHKVRFDQ